MDQKVLKTLEYDKIKEQIQQYIVTANGVIELNQLTPTNGEKTVVNWLDEVDDAVHLIRLNTSLPIPKLADISESLKRLELKAYLNGSELSKITQTLRATNTVKGFFDNLVADGVALKRLNKETSEFNLLPTLLKSLSNAIDEDGRVLDSASPALKKLRGKSLYLESRIKKIMQGFISGASSKYLSEPIITIRDDRYVIPIKASAKQKFGGIVHDQSASGLTLYVEPAAVVSANNDLKETQRKALVEEKRVLRELSEAIRPYGEEIRKDAQLLGHFDLVNAKGKYAAQMKATKPSISTQNHVNLKKARHPLIKQTLVVPNTITLGSNYRQVIITGPNTGGKTITIKTLGINQLMAQSGMFVCAAEGSSVGIFDSVFADIGDEQSIEANLSTFSSHLDNLISILNHITANSLVLIDELGAGTDPREGASLAMAILDAIGKIKSDVMVTTHYPELKVYGYNREETENASMEFDAETLKPTYHLLMGVPGESKALSIAKRLGLSDEIIDEAKSFNQKDSQAINNMIAKLSDQTKEASEKNQELGKLLAADEKLYRDFNQRFQVFKQKRDQLMDKANQKANEAIKKAKQEADEIIADLHQQQKQGASSVKENRLIEAQGKLNALERHPEINHNKVLKKQKSIQKLKAGDEVLVKSYGQSGTLLQKRGNSSWEVQMGAIKMKVEEGNLEKIKPKKQKASHRASVKRTRSSETRPTLDLRGYRYEEAMNALDSYLDSAVMAGYPSVTIIHGKGTGALRSGVTKYLKRNKRVKSFGFSPAGAGGDGSTVVNFK